MLRACKASTGAIGEECLQVKQSEGITQVPLIPAWAIRRPIWMDLSITCIPHLPCFRLDGCAS